jgi:two-component system OmpR family response regulator
LRLVVPLQKILIVEDYDTLAEIEALVAVTRGYEVKVATSQAEALATALSWRPDLIILDLVLWGQTDGGERFLDQLGEKAEHEPPVLIVSAVVSDAVVFRLRQIYPRLASLAKPFKVKELSAAIAELVPSPRSSHHS